jgi:hypothetical protein
LPAEASGVFADVYSLKNLEKLKELFDSYIFNTVYPNSIIRGVEEITLEALSNTFKGVGVTCEPPFLVKDKLIIGELFSLIPIESEWCRGYMMRQTEEKHIENLISHGRTALDWGSNDFRGVNSVLSEICNMVWGGLKTRFFNQAKNDSDGIRVQVPIIINHANRYITFGTDEPQLCFRFTLNDKEDNFGPIELYQRFFFHLNWNPEDFVEDEQVVDDFEESGELELF